MIDQPERRLRGIQNVLMAHHAATAKLPNAAIGDEREVLVREFLEKVFPIPYRFGTGAVIDSSGDISGQLDIVVEWPFFASFPAPVGTQRLYLAESVAFVMEVKSDLSSKWNEVEESINKLSKLRRRWSGHLGSIPVELEQPSKEAISKNVRMGFANLPTTVSWIPYVVVGFTGYKTVGTLNEKFKTIPKERCPDAALVIESGAYVSRWQNRISSGAEGFFAFCADGSFFVRNVVVAEPDLRHYLL
jgi:hypothetical protein